MALAITRDFGTTSIPIWQGKVENAIGGFSLAATGLPKDTVIPAGTPFVFDEITRVATMVGGAVLQADATNTATTYRVVKGSTVKAGDYLASVAGGAAYAITAIDTTNSAYDTVTVGTTLGVAYTAGQNLFISIATGATAAAFPVINGLLYDDTLGNPGETVSMTIKGTVYARRLPYYSAGLAALAGLKNIIFSQSK